MVLVSPRHPFTDPAMSYATVADLQDRLGAARLVQLTDLGDPPVGLVVAAVAQKALDDASGEIDGYLAGRYPLPLATAPAVLRVYCIAIAHYRLLGSSADEVAREDYKAAIAYMRSVAKGEIPLMPPAEAPLAQGVGPVLFDAGSKVMGREPSDASAADAAGF